MRMIVRAAAGIPSRDRVERLREGFWLGVAAGGRPAAEFVLRCEEPVVVAVCPFGRSSGRGADAVTVTVSRGGSLEAPPEDGVVILAMDTVLLRQILGADFETLPGAALDIVEAREAVSAVLKVPRSAEQMLAACALRDCVHSGAVRNVYMKSRALELLALAFSGLKAQGRVCPAEGLPPREIDRMLRARDLLPERHEEPPGLGELAAMVGVCETRLKLGFKRVFGVTPFALLRRHRMAVARDLLVLRHCRVSEAATAVGYTNVSHFIDAFVREYGVRPGELIRSGRIVAVAAE